MTTQAIGWTVTPLTYTPVQGSSGAQRLTANVVQSDGDPLPTYDGWTCEIAIFSPFTLQRAIYITGDVAGDADAHALSFGMTFATATTQNLQAGTYRGGVCFIDPDGHRSTSASASMACASSRSRAMSFRARRQRRSDLKRRPARAMSARRRAFRSRARRQPPCAAMSRRSSRSPSTAFRSQPSLDTCRGRACSRGSSRSPRRTSVAFSPNSHPRRQ